MEGRVTNVETVEGDDQSIRMDEEQQQQQQQEHKMMRKDDE